MSRRRYLFGARFVQRCTVLYLVDPGEERYLALCDQCLDFSPPIDGGREKAQSELVASSWEVRHDGLSWCPDCSRARSKAMRRRHSPRANWIVALIVAMEHLPTWLDWALLTG